MIHRPLDAELLNEARRRLVFEEFFVFSAGLALLRSRADARRSRAMPDGLHGSVLRARSPSGSRARSRRAIDDILHDLASGVPMNRLVQGDVGSGKTMVAAACGLLRHTKRPSGRVHGPDGDPRGAARGDALASARAARHFDRAAHRLDDRGAAPPGARRTGRLGASS